MYFPMRSAIARLGGIAAAAKTLGISDKAVGAWVASQTRARPSDEMLMRIAELSGVSLESLELYFTNLETYRSNEYFRRRKPG